MTASKLQLPDIHEIIKPPTPRFKRRCGDCAFARALDGPADNPNVMCWRYPPAVVLYGMQEAPKNVLLPNQQRMQAITNSHYPLLDKNNWCGEFSPKTDGEA